MFDFNRGGRNRWRGSRDSPFSRRVAGRRLQVALAARLFPLVLAVGLVWLAQHFLLSETFTVQRIEVVGNQLVPADQIRMAAGLDHQNIFTLNRRSVQAAVLRLRPINAVDVSFDWPDTVKLSVAERRPAYIWKVDPTLFLVSEDGVVLAPTPVENQSVILVDIDRRPVNVGDIVNAKALAGARYLKNVLPSAVGITPHYFEYSHALGVVLPTDRGYRVVFGFGDDLPAKVVTFRAIAETLSQNQISAELVDLRFKDRPYYR